jgi:hypothetical protein
MEISNFSVSVAKNPEHKKAADLTRICGNYYSWFIPNHRGVFKA